MSKKKPAARRKPAPAFEERGFTLAMPAMMREHPLDSFAVLLAAAAALTISVNALMLQDMSTAQSAPTLVSAPAAAAAAPATKPNDLPPPPPAPTSAHGEDANMLVREVQSELARRGLYDGPTDGQYGPKTEAAILDFEIGAGLKPTGRPNPQLLAAMRTNSQPAVAASPRVQSVQRVLDQQGFGPVKADGVAGEATRAAIRRFEASRGLPQKGDITPAILRQLSKVSGAKFD